MQAEALTATLSLVFMKWKPELGNVRVGDPIGSLNAANAKVQPVFEYPCFALEK